MALTEYRRKRDFRRTPEPRGGGKKAATGPRFVVQKHAARRLHYDFRLELDGVLKSWAVPKGPSLDPHVKSLAIEVEDHPLEYGTFEGVIPPGEYGGGTVMVWDHGVWAPEGDPQDGYKKGSLKFRLHGEKLRGAWTLVRVRGKANEDGKNWLLIKKDDEAARPAGKYSLLTKEPRSVLSGREMDEIAGDADRVWTKNGEQLRTSTRAARAKPPAKKSATERPAKKAKTDTAQSLDPSKLKAARRRAQPTELRPQLATLAQKVPEGDDWLHEIKFDGYRILAFVKAGKVRLISRNGNDWTARFSQIAEHVQSLPIQEAILDGEIVSLAADGSTSFQRLQNWLKRGKSDEVVYYAFDVPHLNGYDLTAAPLAERKELLERMLLSKHPQNDGPVRYSDHIQGHGQSVLENACRHALEGVISKRADAKYLQGRARSWLKVKCTKRQEFVIGGYTKPSGSRTGFGALLLGYYDGRKLHYCGRVGTGFTHDSLRQITKELKARKIDSPPFANPPTGSQRKGVTWVRPELVGEVEFGEWTEDDRLRHPSFQGLREDKPARQVVRERPTAGKYGLAGESPPARATAAERTRRSAKRGGTRKGTAVKSETDERIAGVRLTNPERVLYPQQGITKRDLAEFYEAISEWILPHIVDRPLTLVRCPKGREGHCFYQKHLTESMPESLRGVWIEEGKGRHEYVVVDDVAGLVSLVQMGVLEMHPWPARTDDLDHPDQLVFDLDPGEGTSWKDVIQAARDVRERLERVGLETFLRTSGGKGLHVVTPIERRHTWDEVKQFAKSVADDLTKTSPTRYIATMSKARRRGKIFVDYLRNQRGATAIASYSTRARSGAPVATPIRWDELTGRLSPDKYTVTNLPRRLASLTEDPWHDFFSLRQSIQRS